MFDHKCQFKVKPKNSVNLEELELELIDFGVQELFPEEDFIIIYAGFESFGPMQKFLEEHEFEIVNAEFERIPSDLKELNAEQVVEIEKLLARLEEDDDVTNVFHNMK